MNIDDLPQHLLVEILCRLPRNEIVFQCKCVSKRWSALISNSYFVLRFISMRKGTTEDTLFFENSEWKEGDAPNKNKEVFTMSAHSAGFTTRKFFLSVGHCFDRLIVVATYNDLILCYPDVGLQRDYYICNPYTKHWVALPPPPGVCQTIVKAGFIFNHAYYNYKELDGGIELNAEYRYRVVLIPQRRPTSSQFLLEIFSSETGEWTQSVIPCPQHFLNFYDLTTEMLAYDGMLYWCAPGGILMELDPFNNNTTSTTSSSGYIFQDAFCRFIAFDRPAALEEIQHIDCLSVYQGGLRMCHFEKEETLCVWEWKQVQGQSNNGGIGKLMKWVLIKKFFLEQLVTESNPVIVEWLNTHAWSEASVLALDPKDEDIFYVDLDGDIVACNFRTRISFNRVRGSPKSGLSIFVESLPIVTPMLADTSS